MTKLHAGSFLWPTYNHIPEPSSPSTPSSLNTEVTIVGGGISGLITAYYLWKAKIPFVLVEENKIGSGSTLASTGLIQYCSDIQLADLRSQVGKEKADWFYLQSAQAVFDLASIADEVKEDVGDTHFRWRHSIQYASCEADNIKLTQQFNAFRSIQLPCELVGITALNTILPLGEVIALKTMNDAELNPFLFTRYLASFLLKQGANVYEYAKLTKQTQNGVVNYKVNGNIPVKTKHVIYCVGYQPEQLQQPYLIPILNRSYVIASEPIADLNRHYNGDLIWETASPYFYVRSTVDNRIIIGGLDDHIATPNDDITLTNQKNSILLNKLKQYFPKLNVNINFSWNATFAESRDAVPYIGPDPNDPTISYLCGYGGNGTVYSVLGAKLLTEYIASPSSYKNNLLSSMLQINR